MPVFATTAPTADAIYNASKLKWQKLGYPDASTLEDVVLEAIAYLITITGRYYDDWAAPGYDGATPFMATPNLIPIANKVVRMRTEQTAQQAQPGYVSTATDDTVSSFSAGPYSETRRDPTRRGEEKTLNLWPELNTLLWVLMTEERSGYWTALLSGKNVPAFEVEEVYWGLIGKDFPPGIGIPYLTDENAPWTMWSP